MTSVAQTPSRVVGGRRHAWRTWLRWLAPWALPLAILVAWEVAAQAGFVNARLLPAPSTIALAFWRTLMDGSLILNTAASAERAFIGLIIGGGLGFAAGLATGLWKPAEVFLDSTVQMLRNIPHLALIPLVILWFGIGETAKIFLVSIGVFFPIYINTFHGVRTVDDQVVEMAEVYGLSRRAILTRIVLPGALPSILVGLRYALGFMWLTLIVAETISASTGLGFMTMNAREFLQTDIVILGILIYALLGKAADAATRSIERRVLAWHPAYASKQGDRP
ncbi:sulfonate transport system permease protein [Aureimonas altamirensis DSM 21988]|uniref:Sulfonate transport system permease protein n=1 Tax=Aureimonas altamirensis DSM 21988 TaxID=1121026 RepID=A0ABY1IEH0_9HYPH|nr:ABC transporter permease subunit [Aureimonas altamirensis]SHJ05374.1 sulfonate transport system permease protein [Aureimonas altamirensis DSM 21988]